jgi:shikimate dehydrogenase
MISYEALSKMDHIDILVNCTPVGSYPNYGTPYEPVNQVIELVIDLIYNPRITILMEYGIKSINGIDLLIYQGIASESIWQKKALKDDFVTIESIKEVLK